MPVVDLSRLNLQTAGNTDLQREVLHLFIEALPEQLGRLKDGSEAERRAVAHQIVGTARAIGAGEVARLAALVEAGSGDVPALGAALRAAGRFIVEHLGQTNSDATFPP